MEILVERNQTVTIYFPMIKAGSNDFATSGDWTPVNGDGNYIVDGGTPGTPSSTAVYEGGYVWSLSLLAAEVNGGRTQIAIIDSAAKAVEDQMITVLTWGDDSAGLPFNAIADYVLRRGFQAMIDSSRGDTKGFRSLAGAVAKLVNRIYRSGSNLLITEDDDVTTLGTQAMTTNPGAEQITDLDTT
ncbi:MAG: hypothetical protein GQ524_11330 [Anaerolineales bacterium]|nr:hypothetical protein [Anaerolineales bacterium]